MWLLIANVTRWHRTKRSSERASKHETARTHQACRTPGVPHRVPTHYSQPHDHNLAKPKECLGPRLCLEPSRGEEEPDRVKDRSIQEQQACTVAGYDERVARNGNHLSPLFRYLFIYRQLVEYNNWMLRRGEERSTSLPIEQLIICSPPLPYL